MMKKTAKIQNISALEILDSRGNPTIETRTTLENGIQARAAVPSGASTGTHEALELRDQDSRYQGKGVQKAVKNVNKVIAPKLKGLDPTDQKTLDQKLLELDGTKNKEKLGANAILSVSIATLKAAALSLNKPTFQHISTLFNHQPQKYTLPIPLINVLNGGKHAQNSLDFQEYMLVPHGVPNFSEAIRWASEIFHTLGDILHSQNLATTVGDEGGYAPTLSSNEQPLELIIQAIKKANYQPGKDISLALDPAASEFHQNDQYHLKADQKTLSSKELIQLYKSWSEKYPITLIEDGLAENDWEGFVLLTQELGNKIQIVGDDLFVTNTKFLQKGINKKAANSILIKPNQIGTITETLQTIKLALESDFTAIISHRSGDTEDPFIADLAVGTGVGQIKTGSLSRSERTAKYNQILRIENWLQDQTQLANFPFKT